MQKLISFFMRVVKRIRELPFSTRCVLVAAVVTAAGGAVFLLPRIPQPQWYHEFADQRPLAGVPNAADVLSNLAFALAGAAGLAALARDKAKLRGKAKPSGERWSYATFFAGLGLTALGSGYYHLAPDNARLLWDRLPMTVAFGGLTAAMISERIDDKLGARLLPLLVAAGAGSVIYWRVSEAAGRGDLRPYLVMHGVPALAIPLLALCFPPRYTEGRYLAWTIALYGAAKLTEVFDKQFYSALGISGHTLKHLLAAGAGLAIARMLARRQPIDQPQTCRAAA